MAKSEFRSSNVAWGKVRDALAAVHNLETLLRSPRVGGSVVAGLLPELLGSCAAIRAAFDAQPAGSARTDLAKFALGRLDALEQSIKEAASADIEARARLALEQVVGRVSGELDASVELLELVERAEAATPTELSLEELAKASLGIGAGIAHGEEVLVRVDTRDARCVLIADPHVVSRLVAAAIARLRAQGAREVLVTATCETRDARLRVSVADASSAPFPTAPARVTPRIPPTDAVVAQAARAIGGSIAASERAVVLTLPRGAA